jgi:hypothetical protein
VTLFTGTLGFGLQTLTIYASLTHFAISPLSLDIELLAVASELIVTWTGPRSYLDQDHILGTRYTGANH